jgi:hypothetical protein
MMNMPFFICFESVAVIGWWLVDSHQPRVFGELSPLRAPKCGTTVTRAGNTLPHGAPLQPQITDEKSSQNEDFPRHEIQ